MGDNKDREESRTKELKKLAWDIAAGQVFTSRHIRKGDERLLHIIFMPLVFLSEAQVEEMKLKDVDLIYEYMDKAGPRAINGYPMFTSFASLSVAETKIVSGYVDKILKAKDKFEDSQEQLDMFGDI